MKHLSVAAPDRLFSPLRLQERSLGFRAIAIAIGVAVLTLSSYIQVPLKPTPITMQTFAVTLVGALYGWRLGGVTIAVWLFQGAIGLPVLAGGAAGAHHFAGPTGGYLFAFLAVGALCGWLAERGWNGRRPILALLNMLIGNGLCLALGAAWLAVLIGVDAAIVHGVAPFLLGAALKSALAAALLAMLATGRK